MPRCYRRCPKSPCGAVTDRLVGRSCPQRPRTNDIVPPAVWHCEASSLARCNGPPGRSRRPCGISAVRRWVCIIALLAGFSGSGYAWTARPRSPCRSSACSPRGSDGGRSRARTGGCGPDPDEPGGEPVPPSRVRRIVIAVLALLVVAALVVPRLPGVLQSTDRPIAAGSASTGSATILASQPSSIDPARHGDAASAAIVAQLFETLTAFDASLTLRPALAESWTVEDGGRRVVFQLRDGLEFSDGTPLVAADVVRSWRRLVTPGSLSPLASLLADVKGVPEILAGTAADSTAIGLSADGDRRVVVDLARPAADFPSIASSPPLGVVPASMTERDVPLAAQGFVGSGGYRVTGVSGDKLELTANDRYWAGSPPIKQITVVTDLAGRSPVEAFADGQLDVAPIGDLDARWIAYDKGLGPTLREVPSLTLEYYAFDTTKPPFDDARVRRAFAMAVDWRRIAGLDDASSSDARDGMVPLGIPGRPDGDYRPPFDPDGAKRLLAEAGVVGGRSRPSSSSRPVGVTTTPSSPTCASTWAFASTTRRWTSATTRVAWTTIPGDVVDHLGRGLPEPQRLPGRAPGLRLDCERGSLAVTRVRRRDR